MPKYIRSLKRVVPDGNNGKTLEEYDFAVKAENVIVTTANGDETNVNNALMQLTEPVTFVLDNNAQSWYENNKISWEMICDSLENNTIQNYLKVGDEIDIQVGDETLPFFVLGINTYNGQPKDQFGKTHIDLGCPQMSKILSAMNPLPNINTAFPLGNIKSNTGVLENNITYLTMFEYSFFKELNNPNGYQNNLIRTLLLNDSNTTAFLKPKMLFLDRRYGVSDEVRRRLLSLFSSASQPENILRDLINLSEFSVITNITDNTIISWKDIRSTSENWSQFAGSAFDFITNYVNSKTAAMLHRINIRLDYGSLYDDIYYTFVSHLGSLAMSAQASSIGFEEQENLLGFIAYLAYFIKQQRKGINKSTDCRLIYNNENNSPLFWSLTEMDVFGKCTLGSQWYSQGQLFQYPYFKNLMQKKQFVSFLDSENKSLMTITPVDDTLNQLVGYSGQNNENLLCPTSIVLPTYQAQDGTSNYDVALCFRLQA